MTEIEETLSKISNRKLKSILRDEEKIAKAANLVYVSDTEEGIERRGKGKKFSYFFKNEPVKDDETLLRIKQLVIPPAWENVWICAKENGHLQVTGLDVKGRKQYKYHSSWSLIRNRTKFYRMIDFGKALPVMRLRVEKDLSIKELNVKKVLAAAVSMMERTSIRVGNSFYEKEYKSYGLTTLKDNHVKFKKRAAIFTFIGKKGVQQNVTLKNQRLINIIKQCQEVPGKELFQFYDEEGNHHSIGSGMVNDYIKEISGADFTAKDFRTWSGTVHAFLALKDIGCCDTATETKRRIVQALDEVSDYLGNTRTVCKKYYVHPVILTLFESQKLDKYISDLDKIEKDDDKSSLTPAEKMVMKILESN